MNSQVVNSNGHFHSFSCYLGINWNVHVHLYKSLSPSVFICGSTIAKGCWTFIFFFFIRIFCGRSRYFYRFLNIKFWLLNMYLFFLFTLLLLFFFSFFFASLFFFLLLLFSFLLFSIFNKSISKSFSYSLFTLF